MEYDGTNRYTYNSDGSLAGVDNGEFVPSYMYNAAVYSYKYDALGRRVLKESDSGDSVLYLYDASDHCIAEYTSADDCATLAYSAGYIYADADGAGAPVAVEDAGGGYDFIATDPQGNVIYQTPSSSYIVLVKYDAYGNVYNTSAADLNLPFMFAGMRCEKDADIYLTPNRAYSPALGRWLQVDPLGTLPNPKQGNRFAPLVQYTDGQNLYEYCSGDPVNERDLWGLIITGNPHVDFRPQDYTIHEETPEQKCSNWIADELKDMEWLNSLPDCPKKIKVCDGKIMSPCAKWTPEKTYLWGLIDFAKKYHPGSFGCMRFMASSGAGQQCCYDKKGELITKGLGAGTPDRISSKTSVKKHMEADVEMFNYCKNKLGDNWVINNYLRVRPVNQGGDNIGCN